MPPVSPAARRWPPLPVLATFALLMHQSLNLTAPAAPPLRAAPHTQSGAEMFQSDWLPREVERSESLAWGDVDGDGDLDLAVGNDGNPNRLYRNEGGRLSAHPVWSSGTTSKTLSLAWGDVDGDGDLDLAVGNSDEPSVLYHNVGGTLASQPAWSSAVADTLRSLAWGDVDGDGDLDLAVGNREGPNRLYHNHGGTLARDPIWSSTEADNTHNVAWGDVDGDGDLDLAAGNMGKPCRLYRNDGGQLTVMAVWSSTQPVQAQQLAWGDVDGDGDLDLAVGNWGQPSQLYRNDGGQLGRNPIWSSPETTFTSSVAWGDMDGDGDLDLAVGNSTQPNSPQPSRVYANEGGRLISQSIWSSPPHATQSVAWGDVDGDGDLDLAVANWNQPNRLYRNQRSPLTLRAVWPTPTVDGTQGVAWGDVDGDGDLDLAVGNREGPNRLYRNHGGTLREAPAWSSREVAVTHSVAWGDADGDGDLDLAVGNEGQPNRLYRNDDGTLTERAVWSSREVATTLSIAWADVDGDGDPDLAVGNEWEPSRLYRNDGGTLTEQAVWSSIEFARSFAIAWGDVDGDGDPDLAVGNADQAKRLYRNDSGTLTSRAVWTSVEADSTLSIAWGDVDGDGDLDLAVGNQHHPNRLYRNDSGTLTEQAVWSAATAEQTYSVAWGDMDNDGDADLAVGNSLRPSMLYRNDAGTLTAKPVWSSTETGSVRELAWGDVDGDADLDLVVGNRSSPNRLYRNDGGTLTPQAVWPQNNAYDTKSVAWGDVDGDGDLDLAVGNWGQPNRVYRNEGGALSAQPAWTAALPERTTSIAWGDVDGDGDLDLAVGNDDQPSRLYRNDSGTLRQEVIWISQETARTSSVAWGDVDGDGDLDLAVGNVEHLNQVYRNDGGTLSAQPAWTAAATKRTTSIAWGDVDGDGDLDLAVGNYNQPNQVYRNDNGILTEAGAWASKEIDSTLSVAWGDADNDGDLDLAVGNWDQPNRLYRNDSGTLTEAAWSSTEWENTCSVAWGDIDNDGDLDLATGNDGQPNQIHRNTRLPKPATAAVPSIRLQPSGHSHTPTPHSSAQIHSAATLPFTYTLSHPQGATVRRVVGQYSLDGGGHWHPALASTATLTTNLPTTPTGVVYTYTWDIWGSGVVGQSDTVVFRLLILPTLTTPPNQVPDLHQYALAAATTTPLRVRGRQLRVLHGDAPAVNALVYRLPSGHSAGGLLVRDNADKPLRTNTEGYLQGRPPFAADDRLFALLPLTTTGHLTTYYTSAQPTSDGLALPKVIASGVQTLTVSAAHPLLLFDLRVALEWDARADPSYLPQLESDLKKASRYLYDITDGQVALGHVTVHQQADEWANADVVVHASNRLRPFAAQGGRVLTATVDPEHPAITYTPGQIHMGATWNRYGNPGPNLGEDWPLILAHELGHYLLFLDDTYLGLTDAGLLTPVFTCTGSAMGDLYDRPEQTELIADAAHWQAHCTNTLAHRALGRTEWATLRQWYPQLHAPAAPNPGPSQMPLSFTDVTIRVPITPTATLDDPSFHLDYGNERANSSEARAFLLRSTGYVIDLGSPLAGQNRVLARGARAGDHLCVFDRPRQRYGCAVLTTGSASISMTHDPAWQPIVQISPVTSTTLMLEVTAPRDLPLQAQLYPEYGVAGPPITLEPHGATYRGTLHLREPALVGTLHLWANEEARPRREVLVTYAIGGNPGYTHAGDGYVRGGGGYTHAGDAPVRGGYGYGRSDHAPLISANGQMTFVRTDPAPLEVGQFYSVQEMAGLPDVPPGKQPIGQSYQLIAAPGTPTLVGSISFQYQQTDVLTAQANENQLHIHFWDGHAWRALATIRDHTTNMASAASQGAGIYALLAGVTAPRPTTLGPAWATSGVSTTLVISGSAFLAPAQVALIGATATYTLPAQVLRPDALTVVVPPRLGAGTYDVVVAQGDGGRGRAPQPFALYPPITACFADRFGSGDGQWSRTGDWAIVTLPDGGQALTDSPQGSYAQATRPPNRLVTSSTTQPFSLAGCAQPVLTFRHDYALASGSPDADRGTVAISADGGRSWTTLAAFRGTHSRASGTKREAGGAEWAVPQWETVRLDLRGYGGTVQLRFGLEVDHALAERGWLIDDVQVAVGGPVPAPVFRAYLPLMTNDP